MARRWTKPLFAAALTTLGYVGYRAHDPDFQEYVSEEHPEVYQSMLRVMSGVRRIMPARESGGHEEALDQLARSDPEGYLSQRMALLREQLAEAEHEEPKTKAHEAALTKRRELIQEQLVELEHQKQTVRRFRDDNQRRAAEAAQTIAGGSGRSR